MLNCFEYKLHADVDNTGLMESPFPKPHFSFDDDDAVAFLSAYKKWIDY